MAKATMSTVKSFIRKNSDNLLIKFKSAFDGRTDGTEFFTGAKFRKAVLEDFNNNTLGVKGAWFVGGSRNYIQPYDKEGVRGFEISNCCGSFVIGVAN